MSYENDIKADKFNGVDHDEAPEGFYAISKKLATTSNICDSCEARKLCIENADDWCLKNRCMAVGIIAFKDGKTYSRKDGIGVIFKVKISKEAYWWKSLGRQTQVKYMKTLWPDVGNHENVYDLMDEELVKLYTKFFNPK